MTVLHDWKVVPISKGQLLDVNPSDLIVVDRGAIDNDGLYRLCDTYKGGGGYDKFPHIAKSRGLVTDVNSIRVQFVVQIQGCNLDCPYCYVTREGVWGDFIKVSTKELVTDFIRSGVGVFHLMGGAPALQMKYWPELIDNLFGRTENAIFHSDLMLSESNYDYVVLDAISKPRCLYAINVKGFNAEEWKRNTRKEFDPDMFWNNLWLLSVIKSFPAYMTFTGCDKSLFPSFCLEAQRNGVDISRFLEDSYFIDILSYKALVHVDDVPWSGR